MVIDWTSNQTLLLIFGAGIIIRSLYAIKKWQDLTLWGLSWLFPIFWVIDTYANKDFILEQVLLTGFLAFAFGSTLLLYKNILPKIREHALLFLTLVFVYCFIKYALFLNTAMPYVFLIALIPSVSIIYLAFVNKQLHMYFKLFFYMWFILLNLFFIVFYLFSKEISLLDYSKLNFSSPIDAFLTGFTVFTLMANICFIYLFVLPGGKHTSWEMRKKIWKEYTNVLISKHENDQLHYYQTILILLIAGGGLVLNYYFVLISDGILIPTYLFMSQFFFPTSRSLPERN